MPTRAAIGCTATVKPRYLMCRRHWRMVPIPLQRAVWHAWRAVRTAPKAYEAARQVAIDAVYRMEAAAP